MNFNFNEYLEKGTKKIIEVISSIDISDEEKNSIIEAFSNEISSNIGNVSNLRNYEQLAYEGSIGFIDKKISSILSIQDATISDYQNGISLCERLKELIAEFDLRGWMLPDISNGNVSKCIEKMQNRQEAISFKNKIIDEDQRISSLIMKANHDLNPDLCDEVLALLTVFEKDMILAKDKNISLSDLENKDVNNCKEKVYFIREKAAQKSKLYQSIFDIDQKISQLIFSNIITDEVCAEIVNLCQKQKALLEGIKKSNWMMPTLKCPELDVLINMYIHFRNMINLDAQLHSERNMLSTDKDYKDYFAKCNQQIVNFNICNNNGWPIPYLNILNPEFVYDSAQKEKKKKENKKSFRKYLLLVCAIACLIMVIAVWGVQQYHKGKARIPFDPATVSEENYKDIHDELREAGFTNIIDIQDESGWLESGKVISVSFDNSLDYKKGSYRKCEARIVITYSSLGRKDITNDLKDWQNSDYEILKKNLEKEGLRNITVEESITSDEGMDNLAAAIFLNTEPYTDEICYLPVNAPITIVYYTYKIGIGNENAQFIGRDYQSVVDELKENGFTKVMIQEVTTGWAKGNSVISVMVNGDDTYSSDAYYKPDVKILVKYSSDDRKDMSYIVENWQVKQYDELYQELSSAGFSNITLAEAETTDFAKNGIVSGIIINDERYTEGDFCIKTATRITIEYYVLYIYIGGNASSFEGRMYTDVVTELKGEGFTNIRLLRADNLITGWVEDEGSIKSISINGNNAFLDVEKFRYDDEIIIVVNTFEGKGCEDITEIAE